MRIFSIVLALGLTSPAQAQETTEVEEAGEVLNLPVGTSLVSPEDSSGDPEPYVLTYPALLTLGKPPSLSESISLVPGGSVILVRQEDGSFVSRQVPAKSFLMPDPFYEKALVKAKQLEICQPALEKMTEVATTWQQRTYDEAQRCLNQYDVDGQMVQTLTKDLQDMEVRALVAEDRLKQARKRAAVAWAITGGVLLGATSAIVVSVAN